MRGMRGATTPRPSVRTACPSAMPASGDGGGDAERCVAGSGRVAREAGSESSEPPKEASAAETEITAGTARVTARRSVGAGRAVVTAHARRVNVAPWSSNQLGGGDQCPGRRDDLRDQGREVLRGRVGVQDAGAQRLAAAEHGTGDERATSRMNRLR